MIYFINGVDLAMENKKNNSIAYFNILKFIGAMAIAILFHYGSNLLMYLNIESPFVSNPILNFLAYNSKFFVEMFFLISGVLFFYAYLPKIINGIKIKEFITKRVIRLFPLLIITTFIMYIGNFILFEYNGTLWTDGSLNLIDLFTDIIFGGKAIFGACNTLNGAIWYINVLMLCYFIAYYLTKLYKKYNSIIFFAIPIFIGLFIYYSGFDYFIWNIWVSRGLTSFFIGILLAKFFEYFKKLDNKYKIFIKIFLLFELIVSMLIMLKINNLLDVYDKMYYYIFFFFPELLLLFYDCNWFNKICSTKFVKLLGDISFGIYLWDYPILITFHILYVTNIFKIQLTSWYFIAINIITHFTIAIISYMLIDKRLVPLLKNKYQKSIIKRQ